MRDIVITGASRGIGRALARSYRVRPPATGARIVVTARDEHRLDELARELEAAGREVVRVVGDLSALAEARALGGRLARVLRPEATLVHNAGLWPSRRELTADGLERSFAVNCAGPLAMQAALLGRGLLGRVMVIGAGLMVKGRVSAERTATGRDFSWWRTYCDTKLAFAVAEREVARDHPEVDFVVLHPGVVRTELGARRGILGAVLRLAKRRFESPEACAARLRDLLARERWSPPGEARWYFETTEQPWPEVTERAETQAEVRRLVRPYVAGP